MVVLIDDVEDSSDHEKSRILHTHPRVAQWASDLLLVSFLDKLKKKSLEMTRKDLQMLLQGSGDERSFSYFSASASGLITCGRCSYRDWS